MKNLTTRKILLGVGLLGATALVGISSPASADPGQRRDVRDAQQDVNQAKRDVRNERQDLHQANTPRERTEARDELRDAQHNLKNEKRDLHDERHDGRDDHRNNAPVIINRPVYVQPVYQRPVYVKPVYGHPVYGRPVPHNQAFRSLEGVVSKDTPGNDFNLRTTSGQQVRVYVQSGESGAISRGDVVRLNGYFSNGVFYDQHTNIIRNR